jgi:hypothetical protein
MSNQLIINREKKSSDAHPICAMRQAHQSFTFIALYQGLKLSRAAGKAPRMLLIIGPTKDR